MRDVALGLVQESVQVRRNNLDRSKPRVGIPEVLDFHEYLKNIIITFSIQEPVTNKSSPVSKSLKLTTRFHGSLAVSERYPGVTGVWGSVRNVTIQSSPHAIFTQITCVARFVCNFDGAFSHRDEKSQPLAAVLAMWQYSNAASASTPQPDPDAVAGMSFKLPSTLSNPPFDWSLCAGLVAWSGCSLSVWHAVASACWLGASAFGWWLCTGFVACDCCFLSASASARSSLYDSGRGWCQSA